MNREDVIRMAREAGLNAEADTLCSYPDHVEPLTAFATRVLMNTDPSSFMSWQEGYAAGAAAEREACAKVCEAERRLGIDDERAYHGELMAAAIRARGNP